jgi:hypothetical protein
MYYPFFLMRSKGVVCDLYVKIKGMDKPQCRKVSSSKQIHLSTSV